MKAKKKPVETITPESLSVDVTPRLETVTLTEPPKRVGGGKVTSVAELVERLKKDGLA
jgi:electron transfer flavoprotein beta subunit